jgi:N-acetylneuraminate synthase
MQTHFQVPVGLSDHTLDNTTAITSVALGACIIEKHVTLDRCGGGPDDSFSLEADELTELCKGAKTAWQSLGKVDYGRKSSEEGNVKFRRSLYFVKDIKAGEIITEEHVKSIRPGYGLAPKDLNKILGKTLKISKNYGSAVRLEDLA